MGRWVVLEQLIRGTEHPGELIRVRDKFNGFLATHSICNIHNIYMLYLLSVPSVGSSLSILTVSSHLGASQPGCTSPQEGGKCCYCHFTDGQMEIQMFRNWTFSSQCLTSASLGR